MPVVAETIDSVWDFLLRRPVERSAADIIVLLTGETKSGKESFISVVNAQRQDEDRGLLAANSTDLAVYTCSYAGSILANRGKKIMLIDTPDLQNNPFSWGYAHYKLIGWIQKHARRKRAVGILHFQPTASSQAAEILLFLHKLLGTTDIMTIALTTRQVSVSGQARNAARDEGQYGPVLRFRQTSSSAWEAIDLLLCGIGVEFAPKSMKPLQPLPQQLDSEPGASDFHAHSRYSPPIHSSHHSPGDDQRTTTTIPDNLFSSWFSHPADEGRNSPSLVAIEPRLFDDSIGRINDFREEYASSPDDPSRNALSRFEEIFEDPGRYKKLLAQKGAEAVKVFSLLQSTLNIDTLEPKMRRSLLVVMQRLVQRSDIVPEELRIADADIQVDEDACEAGGFGDIYRGRMAGENVAVKMIRIYQTSKVDYLMKKFWGEAILWGQLSHANLLPMYGLYRLRGRLSFVSPWMDYGNIDDYLKANANANRQLLVGDVMHGLRYLHSLEIIHGDLKGSNILITPAGIACITDFGLSSVSDPEIRKWTSHLSSGRSLGTLRWQAPELFGAENDNFAPKSKASDIYAWAGVCYEVFTGNIPFFEYPDGAVVLKMISGDRPSRPPPSTSSWTNWGLTEEIWSLMEECWSKASAQRPTIENIRQRFPVTDNEINLRAGLVKWNRLPQCRAYHPENLELKVLDRILSEND